jgi:DNA-binding transcriptional LysR family regulator
MDWRTLPSLSALRAFEAASRLASYSAAARELNVTHAAIAQHVRTVEAHYGCTMMTRVGQSMQVTDIGAPLAKTLTEAFALIEGASARLTKAEATRPLRLSTTPSIAENWLIRRIGSFWAAHPDIAVEIVPSSDVVDLRRDNFDLAIRYGQGAWDGIDALCMMSAGHVVVAASGTPVCCLPELQTAHWITGIRWPESKQWLEAQGLNLEKARVTSLGTDAMVKQAVTSGLGVAVMPAPVVREDIANGTLVKLYEEADTAWAYHLVTHPERQPPGLKPLKAWLMAQALI